MISEWRILKQSKPQRLKDTCEVDGCDRVIQARVYCNRHLQRFYATGDPTKSKREVVRPEKPPVQRRPPWGQTPEQRLRWYGWDETPRGCWEYRGRRNEGGYGAVSVGDLSTGAHRVAYEVWVGPVPAGLVVRHRCDNPPCINPAHLELGTQQDNIDDRERRGRRNVKRNRNPNIKIRDEMLPEIYAAKQAGERAEDIGARYGVSNVTIYNALKHYEALRHESKVLDKGTVDLETAEAVAA